MENSGIRSVWTRCPNSTTICPRATPNWCHSSRVRYCINEKYRLCRKLISTSFVFRLLHSERENIPDVPAVYFCIPSEDNVDRICRDLQSSLYDVYYLNFMTPIPRQQIEDLASAAWQSNCGNAIQKVWSFL